MAEPTWNESEVFLNAIAMPNDRRDAYIESACPTPEARERIRTLIRHHEQASDDFLNISLKSGDDVAPSAQIDEFKIIHRLGEGGMGVVFLAEDTILGRRVALKILGRHLVDSERALGRFREEARNAAALTHPAIVPVYRFGQAGADHYLVTEYVDGPTLSEVIAEQRNSVRPRSGDIDAWYRRAAEIAATVADALDCAHRANIVHRDVKPSNILIDRERGPRLADFGIAKHMIDDDRTETSIVGSCHYMSPEQAGIASKKVDRRSDVFSLGVVLYEMLSFQRPFDGTTPAQILRAIVESTPRRLRTVERRIPVDLETICHKAIEKQPEHRYPTAAHISADLRCFLAGEPIVARPPGIARRLRRVMVRHRRLAAAVLIVLLLATATVEWRRRVGIEESRLCTVSIIGNSESRTWKLFKVDLTDETHPLTELPDNSPSRLTVLPGLYRIRVAQPGRPPVESSLLVRQEGTRLDYRLPEPENVPSLADMVYIEDIVAICGKPGAPAGRHKRELKLAGFYIDRFEVTNAAYKAFVDATGHRMPEIWKQLGYDPTLDQHPIAGISWGDANAYAQFVGRRLPTAAEWEIAMRRPDDRLLPWESSSSMPLPHAATAQSRADYAAHVVPVEAHAEWATPLGLFHGATNVREFTESVLLQGSAQVIIKGASWVDSPVDYDFSDYRTFPFESPDADGTLRAAWSITTGFRCALSASN